MTDTSPLSAPLALPCGVVLPNRLVKAAMTEALADEFSRPTLELCRLYERWSAGGVGLCVTGNVQVDRRHLERPGNVCIDGPQGEAAMARLRALAAAGQKHGCKMIAQLGHAGRQSNGMVNMEPLGPGDVPMTAPHGLPSFVGHVMFGTPRALTVPEVADVVERFASAAAVCKECGFDGVQIHAAHGYLLSSFLNTNANNRAALFGEGDPYGGVLERRAQPLLDVARAVRARCGPGFALSVKLNSADFQQGGLSAGEAVRVAVWLEAEGIDLLEISGGSYEAGIFKADEALADGLPAAAAPKRQSTVLREAYFLQYAVAVKEALRSGRMPVMVTGGWRVRASMERAIERQEIALIGLGRPLCGDPDGARKLLSRSVDSLPVYEQTLQVGFAALGPLYRLLPAGLQSALRMGGQQGWFYRQIVAMARSGEPVAGKWPFWSYLVNTWDEVRMARAMRGMPAECRGSVPRRER